MDGSFTSMTKYTQLADPWHRLTVATLCSGAAAAHPSRMFLADCPDRQGWNGNPAQNLTFSAFDKRARFFAQQLVTLGLETGERVLLVLPGSVDMAVAFAGTLMAGMVPAIIGTEESADGLRSAIERINASAIITTGRIEDMPLAEKARQAAARAMSIRCIAGFGENLPDGVVALDGWSDDEVSPLSADAQASQQSDGLITFGRDSGGLYACFRSQAQLMAEALALATVSRLDRGHTLVSTLQPASCSALSASILLPIFIGASVQLVGPFRSDRLFEAMSHAGTAHLFAPAHFMPALLDEFGEDLRLSGISGLIALARRDDLHSVLSAFDIARANGFTLPLAVMLDFEETACAIFDASAPAVVGQHLHPMEGVTPDETAQIIVELQDGQFIATGGFGLARTLRPHAADLASSA